MPAKMRQAPPDQTYVPARSQVSNPLYARSADRSNVKLAANVLYEGAGETNTVPSTADANAEGYYESGDLDNGTRTNSAWTPCSL